MTERVFSGIQPSGAQVHLGNYLGALKRFVTLSDRYETVVCLVDLHALTSVDSGSSLQEYTRSLAAAYLAVGLDAERVIIFRQGDVPAVCELAWYLSCQFPLGLLERAHAVKDAKSKNISINSGVMFYPILMAADILLYRATKVPVGADQKQHIEMTREIAEKFNSKYGELFPMPEPLIEETTGVIPGIDGRKMSKSYNNYIGLFEEPKAIRKKIMRIVTDSRGVDDIKDPENCNVFNLYRLLATNEEIESLRARYLAPGMGYGHAKEDLFMVVERELSPLRARYHDWLNRQSDLEDILREGARRAKAIADRTIEDVRNAVGVGKYL